MKIVSTGEERTKSGDWREIPLTDGAREALQALPRDGQHILPQITKEALSRAFKRMRCAPARTGACTRCATPTSATWSGPGCRSGRCRFTPATRTTRPPRNTPTGPGATPRAVSSLAL
jgi:hypothetical protein